MQALGLDEVLRRVVAWHNRHPLARRITASQVHSIGEVVLPFASAQAMPGARQPVATEAAAPAQDEAPPPATDLPTERNADTEAPDAAGSADVEIDIALPGTFAMPADDAGSGGAALEMPAPGAEPPEVPPLEPAGTAPDADPDPAGSDDPAAGEAIVDIPADDLRPDNSLDGKPRWRPADPALRPPRPVPAAAVSSPAPQPPRRGAATGWLVALRTALTGRQPGFPKLRAVFSRDFIWPLRPSQVARWVQRHGQPDPLAPTDWPQRVVDTDAQRLAQARQKGLPHQVQLHVLTAAIGVGDRRIRVLIDGRGAVIGPRAYQRSKVAALSSLLLAAAMGLGWGLRPPGEPADDGEAGASLASLAASAPLPGASAASAAAERVATAAPAQAAAHGLAAASAPAASASAATLAAATRLAGAASTASAASAASAAAAASVTTARAAIAAASAALPRLRPDLADAARRTARELAAAASAAADPPPPVVLPTVYAVVTRPSRMRQTAVDFLPTMRSASALLQAPGPDQREVMRSGGKWFAAWWPFATLAEAERARVLLAGRGLKTNVIEF